MEVEVGHAVVVVLWAIKNGKRALVDTHRVCE
jgi:hypothetical protein